MKGNKADERVVIAKGLEKITLKCSSPCEESEAVKPFLLCSVDRSFASILGNSTPRASFIHQCYGIGGNLANQEFGIFQVVATATGHKFGPMSQLSDSKRQPETKILSQNPSPPAELNFSEVTRLTVGNCLFSINALLCSASILAEIDTVLYKVVGRSFRPQAAS